MIVREKLLAEMASFSQQGKWDDALTDIITELMEIRPSNPYLFLQKKFSLRQKMDNSKPSQYLIQLTMYLTHIDPLLANQDLIKDKIISLCVEKFQHTKIKKSEIMQLVNVVLLPVQQSRRDIFAKIIEEMLDREIYTILEYADILYHTVIYRAVMGEVSRLEKRLADFKIELTRSLFLQWLNTVNEQTSITKQLGLQLQNAEIYRGIAMQLSSRITL